MPTSRVVGVRVFAAAPATILPTRPEPVKRTRSQLLSSIKRSAAYYVPRASRGAWRSRRLHRGRRRTPRDQGILGSIPPRGRKRKEQAQRAESQLQHKLLSGRELTLMTAGHPAEIALKRGERAHSQGKFSSISSIGIWGCRSLPKD
jgi:hypothetical protein